MAVTSDILKITANGNGVARTHSFSPLVVYNNSELVATKVDANGDETILIEGTSATTYSIALTTPGSSTGSTGSIDYPASGGTLLQTGESIVMKAVLPQKQGVVLSNQGTYFPKTLEVSLDKATRMIQGMQEILDRAPRVPVSDILAAVDHELPNLADRGGNVYAWDGAGKPIPGPSTAILTSLAASTTLALQTAVVLDTVAGMTALDSTALTDGHAVLLLGRDAANDDGGGLFRWTSPSTATADSGTIFEADDTPVTGRWLREYSGAVNAKWFGAKGDGVASDETALNATIAVAVAGDVFVPKGTYKLTGRLNMKDGVHLFGEGSKTIIKFPGSMAAVSMIRCLSIDDWSIKNLRLEGSVLADTTASSFSNAVYVTSCNNFSIEGLEIDTFVHAGISVFDASTQFIIAKNNIANIVPFTTDLAGVGGIAGVSISGSCKDYWIDRNFIKTIGHAAGDTGVGIRQIRENGATPVRFWVTNNHVRNCAIHGIIIYENDPGTELDLEGSIIALNHIQGTGLTTDGGTSLGNGIYCLQVYHLNIIGNTTKDSCLNISAGAIVEGAIVVSGTVADPSFGPVVISGNTIMNAKIDGISIQANSCIITGNDLRDITGIAIKANGDDTVRNHGLVISGNKVRTSSDDMIQVWKFDEVSVTGNTGFAISGHGVFFNSVRRSSVTGNTAHHVSGLSSDTAILINNAGNVTESSGISVSGNSFNAFPWGCQLADTTDVIVSVNTLVGMTTGGVKMTDATRSHVDVNRITIGTTTVEALLGGSGNVASTFFDNHVTDRSGTTVPFISNAGTGLAVRIRGDIIPINGTWAAGDIVYDRTPGSQIGWICTVAGTPGSWAAFGIVTLKGSKTHDFGSIVDGTFEATDVTVTGAALGDFAEASIAVDIVDMHLSAAVTAANVVTCVMHNETSGTLDLASALLAVQVRKA